MLRKQPWGAQAPTTAAATATTVSAAALKTQAPTTARRTSSRLHGLGLPPPGLAE